MSELPSKQPPSLPLGPTRVNGIRPTLSLRNDVPWKVLAQFVQFFHIDTECLRELERLRVPEQHRRTRLYLRDDPLRNARPLGKFFLSPTALGTEILHNYSSFGRVTSVLSIELVEPGQLNSYLGCLVSFNFLLGASG